MLIQRVNVHSVVKFSTIADGRDEASDLDLEWISDLILVIYDNLHGLYIVRRLIQHRVRC